MYADIDIAHLQKALVSAHRALAFSGKAETFALQAHDSSQKKASNAAVKTQDSTDKAQGYFLKKKETNADKAQGTAYKVQGSSPKTTGDIRKAENSTDKAQGSSLNAEAAEPTEYVQIDFTKKAPPYWNLKTFMTTRYWPLIFKPWKHPYIQNPILTLVHAVFIVINIKDTPWARVKKAVRNETNIYSFKRCRSFSAGFWCVKWHITLLYMYKHSSCN